MSTKNGGSSIFLNPSLSHTLGVNPSFASFGYTHNPVGNILDILDHVTPTENRTHTYDALQRLKTGGTASGAETYGYDLVGNRTTSFLSSTHTHDDLNRLLEDDQFTYTYNLGSLLDLILSYSREPSALHGDEWNVPPGCGGVSRTNRSDRCSSALGWPPARIFHIQRILKTHSLSCQ